MPTIQQRRTMPAIPPFIREPLWDQFAALLPQPQATHPLGRHRPASPTRPSSTSSSKCWCSAAATGASPTLPAQPPPSRRRRDEWAAARRMQHLERIALDADDRMIGLDLGNLAVGGCTTKAPCGGQTAGPSPVDRGKQAANAPWSPTPAESHWARYPPPQIAMTTPCSAPPWMPFPRSAHADRRHGAPGPRLRLPGGARRAGRTRPARADCRAWQAPPDPGRPPLGHRAYPRVDEQLRQAHPLHRAPQARGRVLPRSRHRHRHARSSHPSGLVLLPVADTTSAPPLKPRLLAHLLSDQAPARASTHRPGDDQTSRDPCRPATGLRLADWGGYETRHGGDAHRTRLFSLDDGDAWA